ncbi:Predicted oxidoreductase, contains short-chain dehydrogenase (SDR) and DUF2520 domains [Lishizhenia tianjinensis]|uniref:Predicted oxidoreductase, contains short-chain dehydrogenase (SDR) and DUF2520 domains n=1 Tax=Lishizhenia tianjinensis TaxID=477690 RepID=A0A1I6YZW9_9FLAO|nr:Rossmann-like and DUF2520 domain-containing protein [Lishizhenia tianjinensis]SFT56017.1 Predicted oxidoreductase, contains short-chain dehydrogenase (SDR) and DUF2520 domains [Lishizhenia tianjinensis]
MEKIAIIGSGNVAWHLCKGLQNEHIEISGVYSKTFANSQAFAREFGLEVYQDLEMLNKAEVDLVLVAVNDDQTARLIEQIAAHHKVAYTSGSVNLKDIDHPQVGVFYPLQSFTKGKKVNLFEVPFFIEAKNMELGEQLFDLAWKLSRKVEYADSNTRSELHLAAVFANNFTNHMYSLSKELLENSKGKFEHLLPLIFNAVDKLKNSAPEDIQTGPARRNDEQIIAQHLDKLEGDKKEIYKIISSSIQKKYHEKL